MNAGSGMKRVVAIPLEKKKKNVGSVLILEEPTRPGPGGVGEPLQGSHTPALQNLEGSFSPGGPSSLSSEGMTQPRSSVCLRLSAGPTAAVGSCRGARMGDFEFWPSSSVWPPEEQQI